MGRRVFLGDHFDNFLTCDRPEDTRSWVKLELIGAVDVSTELGKVGSSIGEGIVPFCLEQAAESGRRVLLFHGVVKKSRHQHLVVLGTQAPVPSDLEIRTQCVVDKGSQVEAVCDRLNFDRVLAVDFATLLGEAQRWADISETEAVEARRAD